MAVKIIGTNAKGQMVTVTIDGESTTIETKGFAGGECQKATSGLEIALGKKTTDTATAEMYARSSQVKVKQS